MKITAFETEAEAFASGQRNHPGLLIRTFRSPQYDGWVYVPLLDPGSPFEPERVEWEARL